MYALIQNGAVAQYPYTVAQLRADNPNTSFPAEIPDARLADWGVHVVSQVDKPTYNAMTQNLLELTPVFVNGGWEQNWSVVPASAAEIAERQQALMQSITDDTQARLDDFARTRGYDNIVSACSYATSTHPKYGAEGRYCVSAREATWDTLFAMLAEVQAGTRPVPSGYADIEPELPVLAWPQA